jgi:periplasmic protein CpxP/Spy
MLGGFVMRRVIAMSLLVVLTGFAAQAQTRAPGVTTAAAPAASTPKLTKAQRVEQEVARLRTALMLQPSQDAALRSYIAEVDEPSGYNKARRDRKAAMATMPTPQRLEQQRILRAESLVQFDREAAATKKFYAQLTPVQKMAFDRMPSSQLPD